MKKSVILILSTLFVTASAWTAEEVKPLDYYGDVAQRLAVMLTARHDLRHALNDEISQRAWTNLVSFYDSDRSVFLKSDLEELAKHEKTIDDELKFKDPSFGFDVYKLYCRRLQERIDFATNYLQTATWDFSTNEVYRVKRKDADWPATREEAEEHWRKRLKYEMLLQIVSRELDAEKAAEKSAVTNATEAVVAEEPKTPERTPVENLIRKYRQYITILTEPDAETIMQNYMSAVCRAYDPHTDYFSPTTKEDFDMEMNLSLCGVGAVLTQDDGALKIAEIMPGGPIDKDGRIKKGDKIVAVAQGTNTLEDIMWQPMKQSIRKIRGPKGTRVTLEVIPRSDPSGATRKQYEILREEVKLEDQAATGRVETVTWNGMTNKVGYIYLPAFYGTMDKRPGEEGYRSCADDVAEYIAKFNAQDVEGLILDLRDNGGGSLAEAINMSALFVPSGPVVQIREMGRVGGLPIPSGNPVAFRKPVIVMINRASASASEIVGAHLRDTGRAIVVGDVRSHGKGSVQSVLPMGDERFGSMKLTTARFYRVNGASTQVKGVESDIHLPSLLDSLDIGEDKLDYALPFTKIAKAPYSKCWNLDTYIPALKEASEARLQDNERYKQHLANVTAMKEVSEREFTNLEHDAFKARARSDRALRALAEGNGEDLEGEDEEEALLRRRKSNQRQKDDVVLDETFFILSDLIRLNDGAELPKPPPSLNDWYNAIMGF